MIYEEKLFKETGCISWIHDNFSKNRWICSCKYTNTDLCGLNHPAKRCARSMFERGNGSQPGGSDVSRVSARAPEEEKLPPALGMRGSCTALSRFISRVTGNYAQMFLLFFGLLCSVRGKVKISWKGLECLPRITSEVFTGWMDNQRDFKLSIFPKWAPPKLLARNPKAFRIWLRAYSRFLIDSPLSFIAEKQRQRDTAHKW
jgi:hypothetical protein